MDTGRDQTREFTIWICVRTESYIISISHFCRTMSTFKISVALRTLVGLFATVNTVVILIPKASVTKLFIMCEHVLKHWLVIQILAFG